ncbi:hypothetical protein LguiA_020289 [Lonicera macranthoides]
MEMESEKKKKRERTEEPRPQPRGLVRCSSSADSKKKEEEETTEPEHRRCSTEKEEQKNSKFHLLKPLITTVAKSSTTTTSITIITPPEEPKRHINLYFCIRTDIEAFSWIKLDPSNTPVEAPKPKSNNKKNNHHHQQKRIRLTPISNMPPTTPCTFCVIPPAPSDNQKLVYAFGGVDFFVNGRRSNYSSKAFVCDFASTNPPPVWEELPSMPSQLKIWIGVASPLDGHVYAFGEMLTQHGSGPSTFMGLVFDPSSSSWSPCPHPFNRGGAGYINCPTAITDTTLIDTENRSELCVITDFSEVHTFNLASAKWECSFAAPVPRDQRYLRDPGHASRSTSVAVGHLIYTFYNRKLYARDSSLPKPSFERVHGFDNMLPTGRETYRKAFMVYLGKGKLCVVWGHSPHPTENAPKQTLYITCLKFWVGMCNRRNRLRAVIDRCEQFVAHGIRLYDVIAF